MSRRRTTCSRLSIWETKPGCLSWYDHVVGNTVPEQPFVTPLSRLREEDDFKMPDWDQDEIEKELSYQGEWYKDLLALDEEKSKKSCSKEKALPSIPVDPALAQRDSKPLPPLPYFDYLFADAGPDDNYGGSQNSIDSLSFGKFSSEGDMDDDHRSTCEDGRSDLDSPDSSGPLTPPSLPNTLAEIEEELFDRSLWKAEAEGAWSGSTVHTTNQEVDVSEHDPAGATDIVTEYAGLSVNQLEEHPPPLLPITFGSTQECVFGFPKPEEVERKPTLKPKSQQAKLGRSEVGPVNEDPVNLEQKVTKVPGVEIVKVTKKRNAQESFGSEDTESDGDEVQYVCTKKVRHLEGNTDDVDVTAVNVEIAATESVIDLTMMSDSSSCRVLSTNFLSRKPVAIAPKGYAGQFDGLVIDHSGLPQFKYNNPKSWLPKSAIGHQFGTILHPNGVFTHTALAIDPWNYTADLTREQISESHPVIACMNYANDMTSAAAHPNVAMLRNQDEESLRREAHFECAIARLEGVPVGYYRYYQGHLSLEEYNAADMCICWEPCSCTKMCTRFGDMKCPCARDIVIHGD